MLGKDGDWEGNDKEACRVIACNSCNSFLLFLLCKIWQPSQNSMDVQSFIPIYSNDMIWHFDLRELVSF